MFACKKQGKYRINQEHMKLKKTINSNTRVFYVASLSQLLRELLYHFRRATPLVLATTNSAPPRLHQVGARLKKMNWKRNASTTSTVLTKATGPAFSICRAFVRKLWPAIPRTAISISNQRSRPQDGIFHSPRTDTVMMHSMKPMTA